MQKMDILSKRKLKNENRYNFKKSKITNIAFIITLITLISRVSGYLRDAIFASFFGASVISDAFIIAFRIPTLFRRLLGEGSITLSFIPTFTHYIINKEDLSAYKLCLSSFRLLFFF